MASSEALPSSLTSALGVLLTVSTFVTTFQATRLHRERDRAMARSWDLDKRLEDAGSTNGPTVSLRLIQRQCEAVLAPAGGTLVPLLFLALDVLALAFVLVIASYWCFVRWGGDFSRDVPSAITIVTFVVLELAVVAVALLDLITVWRGRLTSLEGLTGGRIFLTARILEGLSAERLIEDSARISKDPIARAKYFANQAVLDTDAQLALPLLLRAEAALAAVPEREHLTYGGPDGFAGTGFSIGKLLDAAERARKDLLKATELDPDSFESWLALGFCEEVLGDIEAAAAAWRKAQPLMHDMATKMNEPVASSIVRQVTEPSVRRAYGPQRVKTYLCALEEQDDSPELAADTLDMLLVVIRAQYTRRPEALRIVDDVDGSSFTVDDIHGADLDQALTWMEKVVDKLLNAGKGVIAGSSVLSWRKILPDSKKLDNAACRFHRRIDEQTSDDPLGNGIFNEYVRKPAQHYDERDAALLEEKVLHTLKEEGKTMALIQLEWLEREAPDRIIITMRIAELRTRIGNLD